MSENQPLASTGKQSTEHRLASSEPSHDRFADKLTWVVKRSGEVVLTVARSLFSELRATSIATSQQIRRVAMLAIAEARLWQLRCNEQEAKVQCGEQLFNHSLGAPSVLEKIRQLNTRIDAEQATSLDRWRLFYARAQLYSQLSACSSTEVPAALTEVYDVVENARTHAASLRSSLCPQTWTESIRVVTGISGIVLALLAATGFLWTDKLPNGTKTTIASTASSVDKKTPSPNEGNPRQSNARSSTPSIPDTQEARDAAAIEEIEAKPHWNDGPDFTPGPSKGSVKINGIADGAARFQEIRPWLDSQIIIAAALEYETPGKGADTIESISILMFSRDEAKNALDRRDADDFSARAAMQLAAARYLESESDAQREAITNTRLAPIERQRLRSCLLTMRGRLESICRSNYEWMRSEASGKLTLK